MDEKPRPRRIGETEFTKVYHYEKLKAEYLSATLRDMRLHCSDPTNFNDPWDCDPWFDEKSLEDVETLEKVLAYQRKTAPNVLPEKDLLFYENRLRRWQYERVNLNAGLSEENTALIGKRRLYCLTPYPDSTLMWSHYAENHKGICLEFSIDNPLMSLALEVLYPEDYPVWLPHEFDEDHDRAIEMILTKAKPWDYESEFRIIGLHDNAKETAGPLYVESGCFVLPPNALKAVIAGCNADYDAVKAIVKTHMPDLPVKRAIRVQSQFKLLIMDEEALK